MYEDFRATERWSEEEVHCLYQALVLAISTRHADAVDIPYGSPCPCPGGWNMASARARS
jgi:hypothetical protein